MSDLFCELKCFSSTDHLSQLYTGFGELNRRGLITVKISREQSYKPAGMQFLIVELNSKIKIFYDLEDHEIINQKYLDASDYYFKRSFDSGKHPRFSEKILPLGLNYPVNGEYNFAFQRFVWDSLKSRKPADLYRSFMSYGQRRNVTKVSNFEGYPQFDENPKILFLAKLWNPNGVERKELKEERFYINEMRVGCVRRLKAEFKENFLGDLSPDNYT